jgi:hypothetical protein
MHHAIRTLALVAATGLAAGHVSAQIACPGGTTQITGAALQTLVSNRTICAASSTNSDTWQEYHDPNGDLVDWKLGSNPVDPTTKVGIWSVGSNDLLIHNYGSAVYSWMVCQVGTANSFTLRSNSGASDVTGATVRAGKGSCASLSLVAPPGRGVRR